MIDQARVSVADYQAMKKVDRKHYCLDEKAAYEDSPQYEYFSPLQLGADL